MKMLTMAVMLSCAGLARAADGKAPPAPPRKVNQGSQGMCSHEGKSYAPGQVVKQGKQEMRCAMVPTPNGTSAFGFVWEVLKK